MIFITRYYSDNLCNLRAQGAYREILHFENAHKSCDNKNELEEDRQELDNANDISLTSLFSY